MNGSTPMPGRQGDDSLGLPAQHAAAVLLLVRIGRHVGEVGEVRRLRVHDGVEVRAAPRHRVVVHGEVRVPLRRQRREEPLMRGVEDALPAIVSDDHGPEVGQWLPTDVAQAPT